MMRNHKKIHANSKSVNSTEAWLSTGGSRERFIVNGEELEVKLSRGRECCTCSSAATWARSQRWRPGRGRHRRRRPPTRTRSPIPIWSRRPRSRPPPRPYPPSTGPPAAALRPSSSPARLCSPPRSRHATPRKCHSLRAR
jgi:hypothetical protein